MSVDLASFKRQPLKISSSFCCATVGGFRRETALHKAAFWGRYDLVKLLLERGASVSAMDNLGRTALHRAAARGQLEIVSLLIDSGSDVTAKSQIGWNALLMASANGHLAVVRRLLQYEGVDIEDTDNDGTTAFWQACKGGKAAVAKALLLEGGANHAVADRFFEWSPLQIARYKRRRACVEVLKVSLMISQGSALAAWLITLAYSRAHP